MSKIKLTKHHTDDSSGNGFLRQQQHLVRIVAGLCLYTVVEIFIGGYMLIDFDGYGKIVLSQT